MIGQSVGSDANPLSCFLFRPRKSRERRRKCSHTNVSNALVTRTSRLSQTLLQTPLPCFHASINEYYTAKNGLGTIAPRLLSQVKVGTHLGSLRKIAHKGLHAETGAFWTGPLLLLSERSARSPTSPGRVSERQTLPLLSLGRRCSRRTQRACGTAMRLCASLSRRRRGPAGLRDLFSFLSKLRLVRPALRAFPCVRGEGWYHYSQRALRAAETPDGRLQKRLTCRFLRSGGHH